MNPQLSPLTDDQSPGSRPPHAPAHPRDGAADERQRRLHATYVQKVNSVVEAGRPDLADELATTFAQESRDPRRVPRARTGRTAAGRSTPGPVRGLVHRLDQYPLAVFDDGTPTRPLD